MVGSEILGAVLVTSTAKTVIKFLDEKVADIVNKKFGNKPPGEVEALKKEVEELKAKMDSKKESDIVQTDIEEIRNTITKIKQKSLPDAIISYSSFQEWGEKNLSIEEQVPIAASELEMLISKAKELDISDEECTEIQDIKVAIPTNFKAMKEAKRMYRLFHLEEYEQKAKAAEITLRGNIIMAEDYFKNYLEAK